MRERVVYGLMECPIMWGVSAKDRAVYGLIECLGSQCEGSRGVYWAHLVPLCGRSV